MSKQIEIVTYVDDYCHDCDVMCKQTDIYHKDHNTLSKRLRGNTRWARFKSRFLSRGKFP
jgi:hypothetical protein